VQVFDRPPPQNFEAEASVLGAMLLEPKCVHDVQDVITAGDFYVPAHAAVFASIIEVFRETGETDLVSVVTDMRSTGALELIGGTGGLQKLVEECPGPVGASTWAKLVRATAVARRLSQHAAAVAYEAQRVGTLEEAHDLAAMAAEGVRKASDDIDRGNGQMAGDAARDLVDCFALARPAMLASGFDWLDNMTGGGIPAQGVVTFIGPPSHGKTTAALTLMAQLGELHGGGGVIHSVEQRPDRVSATLLASMTGLPVHGWMNRGHRLTDVERHAMAAATARLDAIRLRIEPDPMDAGAIYRRSVRAATKGVRRIMVDYIQDLPPMPGMRNDAEGMGESMRTLARISQDLKMLVVVISQMDKTSRTQGRAPLLNDGRGSSAISDRTDLGISVYRPNFDAQGSGDDGYSADRSITEFTVVKNKFGRLGKATVRFDGESMRFTGDPQPRLAFGT